MSKPENPTDTVKKMLVDKGYRGLTEFFKLRQELHGYFLLELVRLSLESFPNKVTAELIENEYDEAVVEMVDGLTIEEIRKGIEILIVNAFPSYRELLDLRTMDEYTEFMDRLKENMAHVKGEEVIGEYVAQRTEQIRKQVKAKIISWFTVQERQSDEDILAFFASEVDPLLAEQNTYLDW